MVCKQWLTIITLIHKYIFLQTAQKDGNLEKLVLMLNTDRHKVQKKMSKAIMHRWDEVWHMH